MHAIEYSYRPIYKLHRAIVYKISTSCVNCMSEIARHFNHVYSLSHSNMWSVLCVLY